jgi:hypothetical protein
VWAIGSLAVPPHLHRPLAAGLVVVDDGDQPGGSGFVTPVFAATAEDSGRDSAEHRDFVVTGAPPTVV